MGALWRFGIAGPLCSRLIAWGWDAGVPAAYSYRFGPTDAGCHIQVTNSQGDVLDLSDEDNW